MFFNRVPLPDEIRIALEEERLVIFAGAGVSLAPPSNLPTFAGLAAEIAGGGPVESAPLDRFLGMLVRERQTDVHSITAKIVFGPHTKHTLLHTEVMRLFSAASKVRVVTTNFDDHFSAAARKVFRTDRVREFCAPALPLGDDFSGLVYLHGSARLDPKKLVLTDSDFGAAYLTRGWARDFLVSLFSSNTVLFIGYSHNDVTMTYLARGLSPSETAKRWAMVPSNVDASDRAHWDHLQIATIEYPVDPANTKNSHHDLTGFISQWADHTTESVFARARRVRTLARALPSESESDSAYLAYCLSDPQLADVFCKAIRHPAWVGWMNARGYFDSLFTDTASRPRIALSHNVLAHWLCSDVRRSHPVLLLDLFRERQRLSRQLSQTLARQLWADNKGQPDPYFAAWLSILLSQGKDAANEGIWGYLLQKCLYPIHLGVALTLFELLTTPELRIEKGWNWESQSEVGRVRRRESEPQVNYSIRWPSESVHSIGETWLKMFEPHLYEAAEHLAPIIVKQIVHAYLLLAGVSSHSEHWDRLSALRSSIAPHEQDGIHRHDCLSWLIDILRKILDLWIDTNPARARYQAELWWSTGMALLMRFAVYARSRDPQYGPDERLEWILTNDLIFRSGMKKEVFDVLAISYLDASRRVRERLIRRINRGYRGPGVKALDRRTRDYEKFNVLVWLRRADPTCQLVQSAISTIMVVHPNFGERDHPEFDVWHGGARWLDPTEGVDFDRIVSRPPGDFLVDVLKAAKGGTNEVLDSSLEALPRLFKENRSWGRGFVEALAREHSANQIVWSGVFSALRDTLEGSADWKWAFGIIQELPLKRGIYHEVAQLVSRGFFKCHDKWNERMVKQAALLMARAWQLCKNERALTDDSYGDWLTTAINHVGGWIGEFWVHYCSYLRRRAGKRWKGIPRSVRTSIVEALQGKNRTRVHARIAMTPWLGYFFAWDRKLAVSRLLPLLDWQRDPVVAQQSWSVLLNYKRGTSKELELQLIPFYRQHAERVTRMLKDATEKSEQFGSETLQRLGFCLAALVMQVIPDPIESGFFREFLSLIPDEVRRALAAGMGDQLQRIDNKRRKKAMWEKWLKRYLDLRLEGIPVALSVAETEEMLEWCFHLSPAFADVVDRITRMPLKVKDAFSVLHNLADSPKVEEAPLAACRLAIAALRAEIDPVWHQSLETLHVKFAKTIRRAPEFQTYEELLFQRGWRK